MVIGSQHPRALRLQKLHEKMRPAVFTGQILKGFFRLSIPVFLQEYVRRSRKFMVNNAEAVLQQMGLFVRPDLHIFIGESGLKSGDHRSSLRGIIPDAHQAVFRRAVEGGHEQHLIPGKFCLLGTDKVAADVALIKSVEDPAHHVVIVLATLRSGGEGEPFERGKGGIAHQDGRFIFLLLMQQARAQAGKFRADSADLPVDRIFRKIVA